MTSTNFLTVCPVDCLQGLEHILLLQLENRKQLPAAYLVIPPECTWGTGTTQFATVFVDYVEAHLRHKGLPALQPDECIRFWKLSSSGALTGLSAEQKRHQETAFMCKWNPMPDKRQAGYSHLLAAYDNQDERPVRFFNENAVVICEKVPKSGTNLSSHVHISGELSSIC